MAGLGTSQVCMMYSARGNNASKRIWEKLKKIRFTVKVGTVASPPQFGTQNANRQNANRQNANRQNA